MQYHEWPTEWQQWWTEQVLEEVYIPEEQETGLNMMITKHAANHHVIEKPTRGGHRCEPAPRSQTKAEWLAELDQFGTLDRMYARSGGRATVAAAQVERFLFEEE
jgi:hypothetical protein